MVFAALLIVARAAWVWSVKCWGLASAWWEERGRRERFRGWQVEERRVRREGRCVVGILRRGEGKRVRKRVSFDGVAGGELGDGEGCDDLEGQKERFGRRESIVE